MLFLLREHFFYMCSTCFWLQLHRLTTCSVFLMKTTCSFIDVFISAKEFLIFRISNHMTVQMEKNLLCQGQSLNPYFCMTPDLNKTSPHFGYFISLWLLTPPSHVVPDQVFCASDLHSSGGYRNARCRRIFFMHNTKMLKSTLRFCHHLRLDVEV